MTVTESSTSRPLGSAAIFLVMASVFVLECATGSVGNDTRLLGLGALPDTGHLDHEYWRLITFGFLHYDLRHLLLNTVLLLLVGPALERRAGTGWLIVIFLSASVASGAGILFKHQLWPSHGASIGASGGLFGILGAALVLVHRLPSQSRSVRVRLIVVLILGLTYSVLPGISMVGHVIGLVIGIAVAPLVRPRGSPPTQTA
jgi:membrane associated rhomboid family serine protease